MEVIWLNPAAWLGLVALAVPVLIHLLTNQQTRRTPFPTLRFLRTTRLAALKRRTLENWPLLVVRLLMLAAAAAALAAPVFLSDARKDEWQRRVARAIVVAPGRSTGDVDEVVSTERRDSFTSEVFSPRLHLADGLRDAGLWLDSQAPALREVVVIGDLKRGGLSPADLSLVPSAAGLRFLPVAGDAGERTVDRFFQDRRALWRTHVTLDDSHTRVEYERAGDPLTPIVVHAAPQDQPAADAALATLVARGIDLRTTPDRQVIVIFEGGGTADESLARPPSQPWMREALAALPGMSGGERNGTLVVETLVNAATPAATPALHRIADAVFGASLEAEEPARIPPQTLAEWSRPPVTVDERNVQDEGDRRWFWSAVLVLMAVETVLRRARRPEQTDSVEEARVA